MYVRVDVKDHQEEIEGFMFNDSEGNEVRAHIRSDKITELSDDDGNYFSIYHEDIPKLIKALQAAEKHINGGK